MIQLLKQKSRVIVQRKQRKVNEVKDMFKRKSAQNFHINVPNQSFSASSDKPTTRKETSKIKP